MPVIAKLYRLPKLRQQKPVDIMRTKYEQKYNPKRYLISEAVKQRLKWISILEQESGGNITKASKRVGVSREWLSKLYTRFKACDKDPRKLEPKSRAPKNTSNRKRTTQKTIDQIIKLRKKYPAWGKEKLARLMWTQHKIKLGHNTVNRYLTTAGLLNIRISQKNKMAFKNKILKQRIKQRPPKIIKDYKPGALIEKDMKFILKQGRFINTEKFKAKENFFFQHTMIDDFTRMRLLDTVAGADSLSARKSFLKSKSRFPFSIVCINTDSGGENGKAFADCLTKEKIVHFFSRTGTPTDNPRVERSHLTDELEFFAQGNRQHENLESLKAAQRKWEHTYNFSRPHQALNYLTPMEFYQLWKTNPKAAYQIKDNWQAYLKKQAKRLHTARRIKNKEQIEALMHHIDTVLNQKPQSLKV